MKRVLPFLFAVSWIPCASALTIELDYTYDTSNFFALTPVAKSALEAAALDLSNAIISPLGAVTTNIYNGVNGSTTATFTWELNFSNPTTGATETLGTFNFASNTFRMYVGVKSLLGATLGEGTPGGSGVGIGSPAPNPSQWVGAVANAEAASNAAMSRGGGPVIASFSSSATVGATTANYTVVRGALLGSLSLDNDSDNNGLADSAATLANYWHYDHTSAVAPGKNDFYSVALHEMIHALGFGAAKSWDDSKTGTTWNGANVISLTGSGAGILEADQSHIIDGFTSPRVSDGVLQEAVMDPSITVGTRKFLTQLDLAFLRDIGYQTIPEPSSAVLVMFGVALTGVARRRRR